MQIANYVTPNLFIIVQKSPKSLAAGAPPQTPLGSLQRSPRPPSCIGLGWRFENFVPPRQEILGTRLGGAREFLLEKKYTGRK